MAKLNHKLLQICYLILYIFSTASSESINCSPQDFSIDLENGGKVNVKGATVMFQYNRNSLQAYKYPGTPTVNLLFEDSVVFILGHGDKDIPEINIQSGESFNTTLVALANTADISKNKKSLKDCVFGIYDKSVNPQGISQDFKNQIYRQVEGCLESALCKSLDVIESDDFARAKPNRPSFGPFDVYSRTLTRDFPEFTPPSSK